MRRSSSNILIFLGPVLTLDRAVALDNHVLCSIVLSIVLDRGSFVYQTGKPDRLRWEGKSELDINCAVT